MLISMFLAFFAVHPSLAFVYSTLPACPNDKTLLYDKCFGTFDFSDGTIFVGEWLNDQRSGKGTSTLWIFDYRSNKYVPDWNYVGDWNNDQRNGYGVLTFSDGSKYIGEWKADQYNGQGTLYAPNGSALQSGLWESGILVKSGPADLLATVASENISGLSQSTLPACPPDQHQRYHNCFGSFTFPSGEIYLGEWKDDNYHGKGTNTFPNGGKYVGEFRNGNRDGQDTFTSADGTKYAGEFKDDMAGGLGTLTLSDGSKYVGLFKDGKYSDFGTFTFADGAKYVGAWKDGTFNGFGTLTFADGKKYVGEYRDNKPNGHGTEVFTDGRRYIGEWKDGTYDGMGTFYAANNLVLHSGLWLNNTLVQAEPDKELPTVDEPVSTIPDGRGRAFVIGNGDYSNAKSQVGSTARCHSNDCDNRGPRPHGRHWNRY